MSKQSRYTVHIKRSAEKEIDRLPAQAFGRVTKAILSLEHEPRPPGSKKLRGAEDYRLRVGHIVSFMPSTTASASSKSLPSVIGGKSIAASELNGEPAAVVTMSLRS